MEITKRDILDVLLQTVDDEYPDAIIERHGGSEAVIIINDVRFYVNVSRRHSAPEKPSPNVYAI